MMAVFVFVRRFVSKEKKKKKQKTIHELTPRKPK